MVKGDSKRINVRLRTPVRFALEELMERWGVNMTVVLERLITEAHRAGKAPDAKDFEKPIPRLPVGGAIGGAPGEGPFIFCAHCGDRIKVVSDKTTSLCAGCYRAGHKNQANCFKCAEKEHFEKMAAESTSSEPEGIDFNVDWGA